MKVKAIFLFVLFNIAFGLPIAQKRQLAPIQSAIDAITNSLTKLDASIMAFNPSDVNSANALITSSNEVQTSINTATSIVQATPKQLKVSEALDLQDSTDTLGTSVDTVVTDLSLKKATFDQVNLSGVVTQALTQQKAAASALGTALVSKIPNAGQNIATRQAGAITASLDRGLAVFASAPVAAAPAAPAPAAPAPAAPAPAAPAPAAPAPAAAAPAAPDASAAPAASTGGSAPAAPAASTGGSAPADTSASTGTLQPMPASTAGAPPAGITAVLMGN